MVILEVHGVPKGCKPLIVAVEVNAFVQLEQLKVSMPRLMLDIKVGYVERIGSIGLKVGRPRSIVSIISVKVQVVIVEISMLIGVPTYNVVVVMNHTLLQGVVPSTLVAHAVIISIKWKNAQFKLLVHCFL